MPIAQGLPRCNALLRLLLRFVTWSISIQDLVQARADGVLARVSNTLNLSLYYI